MFIHFLLFLTALFFVPVDLKKFDVLIIPVHHSQLRSDLSQELSANPRFRNKPNSRTSYKQDIENYKDLNETPDVDHPYYFENDDTEPILQEQINVLEHNDDSSYGDNKIIGGAEVDINLYPYHVAYGTNCAGAIIGQKWVITARHCGKSPFILTGSKYRNLGKMINVKNYFVHPEWGTKSKQHKFDYDFQILELAENLKFDVNTQPVKVAHYKDMVPGKLVTITGWRNTQVPHSLVLHAVQVPIISKIKCQSVPFPYFRGSLTDRMFCAGFTGGYMKGPCYGDSGGPAVANDRLLGIISFGYGCATPGSYGVYSKMAAVRDWIKTVTGLKLD